MKLTDKFIILALAASFIILGVTFERVKNERNLLRRHVHELEQGLAQVLDAKFGTDFWAAPTSNDLQTTLDGNTNDFVFLLDLDDTNAIAASIQIEEPDPNAPLVIFLDGLEEPQKTLTVQKFIEDHVYANVHWTNGAWKWIHSGEDVFPKEVE